MSWIEKTRTFLREVWQEILKCARPSPPELRESTLVVVVTMGVIGVFIFLSDMSLSYILGFLVNH